MSENEREINLDDRFPLSGKIEEIFIHDRKIRHLKSDGNKDDSGSCDKKKRVDPCRLLVIHFDVIIVVS